MTDIKNLMSYEDYRQSKLKEANLENWKDAKFTPFENTGKYYGYFIKNAGKKIFGDLTDMGNLRNALTLASGSFIQLRLVDDHVKSEIDKAVGRRFEDPNTLAIAATLNGDTTLVIAGKLSAKEHRGAYSLRSNRKEVRTIVDITRYVMETYLMNYMVTLDDRALLKTMLPNLLQYYVYTYQRNNLVKVPHPTPMICIHTDIVEKYGTDWIPTTEFEYKVLREDRYLSEFYHALLTNQPLDYGDLFFTKRLSDGAETHQAYLNNSTLMELIKRLVKYKNNVENEVEEYKRAMSDVATVLMRKKNRDKDIVEIEARYTSNSIFDQVEIDDDADIKRLDIFFDEVNEIVATLPKAKVKEFKVRKLGKHKATGLYFPYFQLIAVDIRNTSSFVHEYFHAIDPYGAENTLVTKFSETDSFETVSEPFKLMLEKHLTTTSIVSKDKLAYYTSTIEMFANLGAIYYRDHIKPTQLTSDEGRMVSGVHKQLEDDAKAAIKVYFDNLIAKMGKNTAVATTKMADVPKVGSPKVESPKVESPKVEPPKVEAPKVEPPKVETPKVEVPKAEPPKVEPPKVNPPKVEVPKAEPPKAATKPAADKKKPAAKSKAKPDADDNSKKSVSEIVVERLIQKIEEGKGLPWLKPFIAPTINWYKETEFTGINRILLDGGEYLTMNQLIEYNQKNKTNYRVVDPKDWHMVVFASPKLTPLTPEQLAETTKGIPDKWKWKITKDKAGVLCFSTWIHRYYREYEISNTADEKGNPLPSKLNKIIFEEHTPAEVLLTPYLAKSGVKLIHGKGAAYYTESGDAVNMPKPGSFLSSEFYYRALFHELAHSTGITSRLNRSCFAKYHEKAERSREELVAEMTSVFLATEAGFRETGLPLANSMEYMRGWIGWMKDNANEVLLGLNQAEKAKQYIMEGKVSRDESMEVAIQDVG